jgi:hypothetical protein
MPTETLSMAGEVSSNICGLRYVAWSAQRIPTAANLDFLDRMETL